MLFQVNSVVKSKIITCCLYMYTKCSCKTTRKISNVFCQRELTIIIILVILENLASELEKIGPILSEFQSISILAIRSNRRQETVSVP